MRRSMRGRGSIRSSRRSGSAGMSAEEKTRVQNASEAGAAGGPESSTTPARSTAAGSTACGASQPNDAGVGTADAAVPASAACRWAPHRRRSPARPGRRTRAPGRAAPGTPAGATAGRPAGRGRPTARFRARSAAAPRRRRRGRGFAAANSRSAKRSASVTEAPTRSSQKGTYPAPPGVVATRPSRTRRARPKSANAASRSSS